MATETMITKSHKIWTKLKESPSFKGVKYSQNGNNERVITFYFRKKRFTLRFSRAVHMIVHTTYGKPFAGVIAIYEKQPTLKEIKANCEYAFSIKSAGPRS